jgi:hypothetical protein
MPVDQIRLSAWFCARRRRRATEDGEGIGERTGTGTPPARHRGPAAVYMLSRSATMGGDWGDTRTPPASNRGPAAVSMLSRSTTMGGDWGEDGIGMQFGRASWAAGHQEDAHVHLQCLDRKDMHNVQVVFCKLPLHES